MTNPAPTEHARRAVLLLGPTGSGKSPLGEMMERRGLWGAQCVHFDFGASLRGLVERDEPDACVTRADLDFLREVLRSGTLLEDRHFPLAERILRSFLSRRAATRETLVVLNGLPRHAGQAEDMGRLLDVAAVAHLICPAETVLARLRINIGGDRAGREDDDLASVREKLAVYAARTEPLVAFYRARGTPVVTLEVTDSMTPDEAWHRLAGMAPPAR